jgi:16S rRNA (cytidine1402-2'-O)-methyltransferase
MPGRLSLVATPIGNLGDLSPRAVEVLGAADFIVCEDTRHSRTLFDQHGIKKELLSLPAFDEAARLGPIVDRLEKGEHGALVTDAGTPAISDPGEALVKEAVRRGIRVEPIPGPSAVIAALSASGLPTARFHFLGFLPRQDSKARAMLEEVKSLRATLVLYESPNRLAETLSALGAVLGSRNACVARELTKLHEEFARGPLEVLARQFSEREVKGEVVVLVEGFAGDERWDEAAVKAALTDGLAAGERLKTLSGEVGKRAGWSAGDVYKLGLSLKK